MRSQDQFYIGWQDKMPGVYQKTVVRAIAIILAIMVSTALFFVLNQNNYENSTFEFGEQTELTGVLYESPVPMLKVFNAETYTSIPLVNPGKFGAESTLASWKNDFSEPLEHFDVTIKGTLFYNNGRPWMELTDGEESLIKHNKKDILSTDRHISQLGEVVVNGEIVGGKCYFGVMNPGSGKVHKSCAIRCISGGIPAVFVSRNGNNVDHFLLKDENGNIISDDLLSFAAVPTSIKGNLELVDDWYVLRFNRNNISLNIETADALAYGLCLN